MAKPEPMSEPKSQLVAMLTGLALLVFASVGFAYMLSSPVSGAGLTATTPAR